MICEVCRSELKIETAIMPESQREIEVMYCEKCKSVKEFTMDDFHNDLEA